jgi:regulator of sirC expression with transglutaminase-like and TPR domain
MITTTNLAPRTVAEADLRALSKINPALIDVGAAALAFAVLREPQRSTKVYLEHLDRLASEAGEMALTVRPQRAEQVAGILREVIAVRHAYKGDESNYDSPDNANLMKVIDRRKGLPVSLGIIYIAVAQANGWNAEGLAFPDHFLVRVEFNGRRLVLDPFRGGEILGAPELRLLAKHHLGAGAELRPEYYSPVSHREVLLRLQNNLKLRYLRLGLDDLAIEVLEAMLLLAPDHALLWREFGLLLAERGQEHRAITALDNFLALSPDEVLRHQTARFVEQLKSVVTN